MARVTIYLPDGLYQRWRDHHPDLNLSRISRRGLYEEMRAAGDGDVVLLCELCHQGVAEAIRLAPKPGHDVVQKRRSAASKNRIGTRAESA